jgi:NitT/TauT family transport system substrate-binding protein
VKAALLNGRVCATSKIPGTMTETDITIAIPDMISNSYFPIVAASELGYFKREGLEVTLELISPADKAYAALHSGAVHLVGAEAHAALAVFPNWSGVKLICAQSQGMYWFLVMRSDLVIASGRGRRIAAAPWVEMGLRRMLIAVGIDPMRDLEIVTLPEILDRQVNTGVALAKALEERRIDGFWANGMGAAVAVHCGAGSVVLDVRRGDGPPGCFDYTLPVVAATDHFLSAAPKTAEAAIRAIAATHTALRRDVGLATAAAKRLFPPLEADLIRNLVQLDLPFYNTSLSEQTVRDLNAFAVDMGLLKQPVPFDKVVATNMNCAAKRGLAQR